MIRVDPKRFAYVARFLHQTRHPFTGVLIRNNLMAGTDGIRAAWEPCQAPGEHVLPPEVVQDLLRSGADRVDYPQGECPDWFRAVPTRVGPRVTVKPPRPTRRYVAIAYDGAIESVSDAPTPEPGCCWFNLELLAPLEPTFLRFSTNNWQTGPVLVNSNAVMMPLRVP